MNRDQDKQNFNKTFKKKYTLYFLQQTPNGDILSKILELIAIYNFKLCPTMQRCKDTFPLNTTGSSYIYTVFEIYFTTRT